MSEVYHLEKMQAADRALIARFEALQRLTNNADFRRVILEDYLIHEAANCAETAGNPTLKVDQRADATEMSKAPGHLKRYLRAIEMMAQQAVSRKVELEEAIHAAREEEDAADNGGNQ